MYKYYYFNDHIDEHGYHEVHTEDCEYLPNAANRTYIGRFENCQEAIKAAKEKYPSKYFDGCFFCCRSCHHG
jgi:hypothetical protein